MYGIIHKALEAMLAGATRDREALSGGAVAGLRSENLLTMKNYSDNLTLELIQKASDQLGVEPAQCIDMLGHFWATEYATRDFSVALPKWGDDLLDYLENLNRLHEKLATVFINYTPPFFELVERKDHYALLKYTSTRTGLTPFVTGVLRGLSERTGQKTQLRLLSTNQHSGGESSLIEILIEGASS